MSTNAPAATPSTPQPNGTGAPATPAVPVPTPPAATPAAPAAPPAPAEPTEPVDFKAKYEEAIGHSRDWEKKAKANKEAAEELEKLRQSQLTAEQRESERLQQLERENAQFKAERQQQQWARDVAQSSGVPAEALRGSTLEEIQTHAEILKPAFAAAAVPTPPLPAVPSIGAQPGGGNVSLADQIAAAEAAGNKQLTAALKAMQLGDSN